MNNPVYKAIIPRVFPELNNIRPDPAAIYHQNHQRSRRSHLYAAKKLSEMSFCGLTTRTPPASAKKFVEGMEQLARREAGGGGSWSTGWCCTQVISRGELIGDLRAATEEVRSSNGHHKPEKEEAA